jgi:hypothetical protein
MVDRADRQTGRASCIMTLSYQNTYENSLSAYMHTYLFGAASFEFKDQERIHSIMFPSPMGPLTVYGVT